MTALAAIRLVRSRRLRDTEIGEFFIVVDLAQQHGETCYRVGTCYGEGTEVLENLEYCAELEQACFVLGTRVKRCLNRMAAERRGRE